MQAWNRNDWFYGGQHGFRPGYFCESHLITVCQDIAGPLDESVGIKALIIDISKAFDFVPHDMLLMKLASSGVDSRVVFCLREFLVGRTHRVRIGGQISMEVKVTSGVPQGGVFFPLLFLLYVNDIWRIVNSSI